MALFKSLVLSDPMEVVSADDDSLLHLSRDDDAAEKTPSDGHISSEGAFLVNVCAFNGFTWSLDAQTNISEPPSLLARNAPNKRHSSLLREGLLVNDFRHDPVGKYGADVQTCKPRMLSGYVVTRETSREKYSVVWQIPRAQKAQYWLMDRPRRRRAQKELMPYATCDSCKRWFRVRRS